MQSQLTVSPEAKQKIFDIITSEGNPNLKLRAFVQGGGCAGFQFGFTLDEEQHEDDFEVDLGEIKVVVDAMSETYLAGAEIDYKEELLGSSFTINNPNASTTCGCGSSFSV